MRYTKIRTWAILIVVLLGVVIILNYSGGSDIYKSKTPITDSLITESYPDLYRAIAKRDINELEPFLLHNSTPVRAQAWRAFANTPVDSLSPFVALAASQNSEVAWFGISRHEVNESQLRALEKRWERNSAIRSGIARVLGQQGDKESLNFLLDKLDNQEIANDYQVALAVGRLILEYDINEKHQLEVLEKAFEVNETATKIAYLYGWYRGDRTRLTSSAADTLYSYWQSFGSGNADIDQFVNNILPERTTAQLTVSYNGKQELNSDNQLAVELAKSVSSLKMTDNKNSLAAKILLTNTSPHVQIQTIKSLKGKISKEGDLYGHISQSMLPDQTLADIVWVQALEASLEIEPNIVSDYQERLQKVAENDPYLWPQVLAVYQKAESPDAYLERTQKLVNSQDTMAVMSAVQAVNRFWGNLPDEEQTESRIKKMRDITFQALLLRDRAVAAVSQSLLRKEELFKAEDFGRINKILGSFSLPDDIEVYQAFASLYKERFEQQAASTIDSLAALSNVSLNRSLADTGWDVNVPEGEAAELRMPNWQRLWELGREPVWILKTEKGPISIKLNTLSAPATVAMIDSLSRAGAYNGIPFHRVIPNFVIQGGDIERGDGFGGPDFVIPTEASERGFERGAVGIASAGTDTEGSQYFIMHQWKPHLNGRYTRFGKVIDGFRYIDRIMVGDKVNTTVWGKAI